MVKNGGWRWREEGGGGEEEDTGGRTWAKKGLDGTAALAPTRTRGGRAGWLAALREGGEGAERSWAVEHLRQGTGGPSAMDQHGAPCPGAVRAGVRGGHRTAQAPGGALRRARAVG